MPISFNRQRFGKNLRRVSSVIPSFPALGIGGSALGALSFRRRQPDPDPLGVVPQNRRYTAVPYRAPVTPPPGGGGTGGGGTGSRYGTSASSSGSVVTSPPSDVATAARDRALGQGESEYQKFAREYYGGLDTNQNVDDQDFYNAELGRMQGSIDAINQIYDQMVGDVKYQGEGRLGQTRALNARSGLLGSDFGIANTAATQGGINKEVRAVNNERALKIASLFTEISQRSMDAAKDARLNAHKNAEEVLAYKKDKMDSARKNVEDLAKAGVYYDQLNDTEYKTLLDQTGYDDQQLKSTFIINKPKEDVLEQGAYGSTYYQISKDPITGKIKSENFDLGFAVPSGYTTEKTSDGRLMFIPKNLDPNKSLDSQIKIYGSSGTFKGSGTGSGSYKLTQGQKSKLLQGGFSLDDVNSMQGDLASGYTIDEVIQNSSLSKGQQDTLRSTLAGSKTTSPASSNVALNRDYFLNTYPTESLYKAAEKAGYSGKGLFRTKKGAVSKYLDKYVLPSIERYRTQGYSDAEILAKMK